VLVKSSLVRALLLIVVLIVLLNRYLNLLVRIHDLRKQQIISVEEKRESLGEVGDRNCRGKKAHKSIREFLRE
jgi:hypothetical protein